MYTYKFVNIDHSMWTGKPKENLEEVIEHLAGQGWRLVQIAQDYGSMWYKGRIRTKIIFEKEATEAFHEPMYQEEYADNFV